LKAVKSVADKEDFPKNDDANRFTGNGASKNASPTTKIADKDESKVSKI